MAFPRLVRVTLLLAALLGLSARSVTASDPSELPPHGPPPIAEVLPEPPVVGCDRGDVDGSGTVTLSDVQAIQNAIAELGTLSEDQLRRADLDGSGTLTPADASAALALATYGCDRARLGRLSLSRGVHCVDLTHSRRCEIHPRSAYRESPLFPRD